MAPWKIHQDISNDMSIDMSMTMGSLSMDA